MYFLALQPENARLNGTSPLRCDTDGTNLRKWTLLSSRPADRELLRLLALACCGHPFLPHLPYERHAFFRDRSLPLRLRFTMACHAPRDVDPGAPAVAAAALEITPDGRATCAADARGASLAPLAVPGFKPSYGTGNSRFFCLAYGPYLRSHAGTDNFQFNDPCFRVTRVASLFDESARLTDPVQFLRRLHYRAIRCSRVPARDTLQRLCTLARDHLGIESESWLDRDRGFSDAWRQLKPWQQRVMLPVLDAVRHVLDANPHRLAPLDEPGVILLDRPDRWCPQGPFAAWIAFTDRILPRMQCFVTLGERARQKLPASVREHHLPLPAATTVAQKQRPGRLEPGTVLLIDVDSRLPNVALMKLSRHLRECGRTVKLLRKEAFLPGADAVYTSSVFSTPASAARVDRLRRYYGDSMQAGGSGVDLKRRLPPEVEALPADFGLYPEIEDRAIGFLTRGCSSRCSFCVVPQKEGRVRRVSDLDMLLAGRKKLILLDDNILAHPDAGTLLEEMAGRGVNVNFTQTLDLRLLNRELAAILKRVHCSNTRFTRPNYHFSLNNSRGLDRVRAAYGMLGLGRSDHAEFVCMYGFATTLREDVERFRFLRSLPGAYVFVQEYQPILGGPAPRPIELFDDDADKLIDELVSILFPQNMKSMERYYRWDRALLTQPVPVSGGHTMPATSRKRGCG